MHKALCLVFFYAEGLGIAPQKVFNFGVFKTARSVEFTSLEMRIGSYETNNITNLDKQDYNLCEANRRSESYLGFESLSLRHKNAQGFMPCVFLCGRVGNSTAESF